jgi:hypothetical protein
VAKELPPGTKFAAIHLCGCACRDLPPSVSLSHELSVQTQPVLVLGQMDEARIGTDYAKAFRSANLVLVASRTSETAGILDGESQELERRVYSLLYGIFMNGVPNYWPGVLTLGSTPIRGHAWANRISLINDLFRNEDVLAAPVTVERLRGAERVIPGMIEVFGTDPDYTRLRRGINGLIQGWKARSVLDRLHAFVRTLDGLMKLKQGAGERQFAEKLTTFATSTRLHEIALEIFRLRSFNEHLSEWPSKLGYIAEQDRPRFVSHRAVQAEALAGAAYRTLLSDVSLLQEFRNSTVDVFWNERRDRWTSRFDLDAFDTHFSYSGPI